MSDYYILNKQGEPEKCSSSTWSHWFQSAPIKDRQVAYYNSDGTKVSTVFLGLNHGDEITPLIWETLVMSGPSEGDMDRCGGCRQNAVDMHNSMLEKLGLNP